MKYLKEIAVCLLLLNHLLGEMLPNDGSIVNYRQVFFSWDQIPEVDSYQLFIQNTSDNTELTFNTIKNSILIENILNWNTTYNWGVCGEFTNGSIQCTSQHQLSINSLPDYYPDNINLINHIPELSQNGITFMDFESLNFSSSLDKNGNPIWFSDKDNFQERFTFTQFFKNGNIIGFGPGKGYEINLDSQILFETLDGTNVHHDFNKTENGTYFLISATIEDHYCPSECNPLLPDEIPWQGDTFIEIDNNGNEIWSWNTFDFIDLTEYNPYYVETYTGSYEMDWTHSNSIFFDKNSSSVFISLRNLSRITKINYENKEVVWNMGESDFMNEMYFNEDLNFSQQHSVKVLDNGNILFFDNHRYLEPELSRCIEIAYNENDMSSEIVWQHTLPSNLFTGSRGDCNRLENGNTLITAGRTGTILEVTPNNEIVWHIEVMDSGTDITMFRSNIYPNLYPIAYSIQINELKGDMNNNYIEPIDNAINISINNSGWYEQELQYELRNENNQQIKTGSFVLQSLTDYTIYLDVSDLPTGNYHLNTYPTADSNKTLSLNFTLSQNLLSGDFNQDGSLNILDIVILSNLVLSEEENLDADLNQDLNINILDIIILINLIMET